MSTRETLEAQREGAIPVAGENASDALIELPKCTIEDIDRAVFDLFDGGRRPFALVDLVRAAVLEPAAGRQVLEAGHHAFDDLKTRLPLVLQARD